MTGRAATTARAAGSHPRQRAQTMSAPDRLHQPAVKTFQRRLPEGAPFEWRKQHQAAPDARLARGLSKPIGRFGPERTIDNDDIRLGRPAQRF